MVSETKAGSARPRPSGDQACEDTPTVASVSAWKPAIAPDASRARNLPGERAGRWQRALDQYRFAAAVPGPLAAYTSSGACVHARADKLFKQRSRGGG